MSIFQGPGQGIRGTGAIAKATRPFLGLGGVLVNIPVQKCERGRNPEITTAGEVGLDFTMEKVTPGRVTS